MMYGLPGYRSRCRRKVASLFASIAVLMVICVAAPAVQADPPSGKSWALVFNDDFNGTSLDTTKWSYNYPWGTTHNGMANMQSDHVTVSGGVLSLVAEKKRTISDPWGYWDNGLNKYISFDYTSGTIYSKSRFQYGYYEARIKIAAPVSTWPAFWMLQDGWPPELDIMESQSARDHYYYTYHFKDGSGNPTSFGGQWHQTNADLSAGWHNFGVEWTPTTLTYYLDGQVMQSFTNATAIAQMGPMYMILDHQVGGWSPDPDANGTGYPCAMQVDWVKIWQLGGPSDATYVMKPSHDLTKALEVPGFATANGTLIDQYTAGTGQNMQWIVSRQSDGSYKIRSGMTWITRYLDLKNNQTTNGGMFQLWDNNNGDNQKYFFTDLGSGLWRITPKIALDKCIAIGSASTANGAKAITWTYAAGPEQKWKLEPQ